MVKWTPLAIAFFLIPLPLAQGGGSAPPHPNLLFGESGNAFVDPVLLDSFRASPVQVAILVLDPAKEARVLSDLARRGDVHHSYPELHMASLLATRLRIEELRRLDGVQVIYHNEQMGLFLDQSTKYVGANILWKTYGIRGKEPNGKPAGIFVVDTGIDGTHPDLKFGVNLKENVVPTRLTSSDPAGRIVGGSKEGVVNSDLDGHGTHVAAIAGGTGKGGRADELGQYRGLAHEAILVGFAAGMVNPVSGEAAFESVSVLEAFNYALKKKEAAKNEYDLRVITNSWGANGKFDPTSPINLATLNLYRAGFVVTFAAGNEGDQGPGSLNKYSVAPWVLSISAGDYYNVRASFSSIGTPGLPYDHPDLMAPGQRIKSARAATTTSSSTGGLPTLVQNAAAREYYIVKSGTSMSTPHVAGAAALLISDNPKLSPDEVYDLLVSTSTPLNDVPLHEGGAGYLNLVNAYRKAQELPGTLDQFLGGRIKYGGRLIGDADYSDDPVSVGLGRNVLHDTGFTLEGAGLFFNDLVTTTQGILFIIGTLLLSLLAFRIRPRAKAVTT